ncbi:MAG: ATP-binding protein [Bacteroidia bacterium]|nr:ATP-binding protein [Bacteroidia bacterium]
MNNLAWELYKTDVNKLDSLSELALDLSEKLHYFQGLSRAKNLKAIALAEVGKSEESILFNLEALELAEKIQDKELIGGASNDLGISYSNLGDFPKSISYYKKALQVKDDFEYIAYTYSNLSNLYFQIGNKEEGEYYLKEAIEAAKNSSKPEIKSNMLLDIAEIHWSAGKLELAEKFYLQADSVGKLQEDLLVQRQARACLSFILFEKEEYKAAMEAYQYALAVKKKLGEKMMGHNFAYLSDLNIKLGDFDLALRNGQKALAIATKNNRKASLPDIYSILSDAHKNLGNYEEALTMKETELRITDSLYSEKSLAALDQFESKIELLEKDEENKRLALEADAQLKELELMKDVVKQQKFTFFWIIIFLLGSAGLLFYVFRLLKTLRTKNKQLLIQSDKLMRAKSIAEKAAQAKADFLSVMSHEIRTPINAVLGMTHLLLDETPRKDQEEHLKTLQFSGNNLLAIVNDILDFSKIEAGKLQLEKISFDLKDLVNSLCSSLKGRAIDKGLEARCTYDPNLPEFFVGDSVRIAQVLSNLMSNAIKFTQQGFVELRVTPASHGRICFSVIDSGIGIPDDRQKSIFEPFTQSSEDTTRKFGGTGLGLSISKKLVSLMGSKLQLVSTEGEGSMFFFEVNLAEAQLNKSQRLKKGDSKLNFGSLKGMKILLAEDNKTNQIVAQKFLEKWEIEVDIAENGKEAIDAWQNKSFDLILMDIQMPIMKGTEASQLIRKMETKTGVHIPIIGFTAGVIPDEVSRILEAGMDDWVGKPFEPAVLHQKLQRFKQDTSKSTI